MRLINIVLLICFPFFLISCINYEQNTKLYADGSGSMKIHYWTKDYNIIGEEIFGFGFTDSKIRENYSSPEIIINEINIIKQEVDTTTHVMVNINFKNFNHLPKAKSFRKVKPVFENQKDSLLFTYTVLKDSLNAIKEGMDQFRLLFEFELPGSVLHTNGIGSGQKIRWEYSMADLAENIEMIAVLDNKPASCGLFGIELPIVLLIGLLFSNLRSKNPKVWIC